MLILLLDTAALPSPYDKGGVPQNDPGGQALHAGGLTRHGGASARCTLAQQPLELRATPACAPV